MYSELDLYDAIANILYNYEIIKIIELGKAKAAISDENTNIVESDLNIDEIKNEAVKARNYRRELNDIRRASFEVVDQSSREPKEPIDIEYEMEENRKDPFRHISKHANRMKNIENEANKRFKLFEETHSYEHMIVYVAYQVFYYQEFPMEVKLTTDYEEFHKKRMEILSSIELNSVAKAYYDTLLSALLFSAKGKEPVQDKQLRR